MPPGSDFSHFETHSVRREVQRSLLAKRRERGLPLWKKRGLPTAQQKAKGGHSNALAWWKQFIAYKVELQIP